MTILERLNALEKNTPERYRSIQEGAEFLGITPSVLTDYCLRGLLPSYKIGNTRKVKFSELDSAMKQFSSDPLGYMSLGF